MRVLFDGVPAPLLYVSENQLSAVVPFEILRRESVQVQVQYGGVRSFPIEVPIVPANPGVFSLAMTGRGPGAVVDEDGVVNSPTTPARPGSIVSIYITGSGQTDPSGVDGQVIGNELPRSLLQAKVFIDGIAGEVLYAGGAPGTVAGITQINVRVPPSVRAASEVPVAVTIGDWSSQAEITMAVR